MKVIIRKIKILLVGILMVLATVVVNPTMVEAETALSKTATRIEGMLNEWEVDLSLEVVPTVKKQDILVVMDRSGSMSSNSRLVNAKKAAKLFVETLLDDTKIHDNRIALISYGRDVTVNQTFTDDEATLLGKINGLTSDGVTFSQGALHEARNVMSGARSGAEKIIVFLSDGAPTVGYGFTQAGKDFALTKPYSQMSRTSFSYTNLATNTSTSVGNKFYSLDGFVEEGLSESYFDYGLPNAGGQGSDSYHYMQRLEGNDNSGKHMLINLYKTLVSEATFTKVEGNTIYTIALDLDGNANASESLRKVASDDSKYFIASSGSLEDKFEAIAQQIQIPFTNMQISDPMGDGFSMVLSPGPVVTTGTAGQTGLTATETLLTWNLAADSFSYNTSTQKYEAHVKYRIRTNVDAIALLQADGATGELPTNKNAVFNYTESGVNHSDAFPVPMAKPTILTVSKKLLGLQGEDLGLTDSALQRQYHYEITDSTGTLGTDYIDNVKIMNHHILQSMNDLEINEVNIVNDDLARFDVEYHFDGNQLLPNLFKLEGDSGLHSMEIRNKLTDYLHTDLAVSKAVVDANENSIAELKETLTYTIEILNNKDVFIRHLNVMDTLSGIKAYFVNPETANITVYRNGTATGEMWTVQDLMDGFMTHLAANESLKLMFDVKVKDSGNLPTALNNTVIVNTKDASATIRALTPVYTSAKTITDANQDGKAESGEALTYTISVINNSEVETQNLIVRDELSNLIANIQGDPDTIIVDVGGVDYTLSQLIAGIEVNVPAATTLNIVFTVVLKDTFDGAVNQVLKNIATVGDQNPEAEISTIYPVITANKSVLDGNENGVAEPGEVLKYVISAKNTGTKAKLLEIKDTLTELLPHIQGDPSTIDITIDGNPYKLIDLINGVTVNVAAGSTVSVYFEVTLDDDFDTTTTTKIKNIATVNGHTPEVEIPTGAVNLNATKAVVDATGDQKAEAGEALTYTISVKNTGTVGAKDVLIKDDLINLMNHIKDPASVKVMVGTVEHTLAQLKNGIYRDLGVGEILLTTFTVVLKDDFDANQVTVLKNIATVGDDKPEVEIPTGKAILGATKLVIDATGDEKAEAGEALTYTISVKNTGNVKANQVLIKDELTEFMGQIKNPDSVIVKVGAVNKTLAELKAGFNLDIPANATIDVVFVLTLIDDFDATTITRLKNIATVGDLNPETEIPTGKAAFEAAKEVTDANEDGLAEAGEALTYTISVKNVGTVKANDVLVKDDLMNLYDHIKNPTAVRFTVGSTEYSLADLMAGIMVDLEVNEKLDFVFTVVLNDDFDADEIKVLKNIATAADKTPETEIPTGKAAFEAAKEVTDANEDGLAEAGEALTYTISVKNVGTVKANDVLVKDDLMNLYDHIKNPTAVRFTVGSTEYSLADLMAGIMVDLEVNEKLDFVFTVVLNDDFDANEIKVLKNIATVHEEKPEVEIPTGKAIIGATKTVSDHGGDFYAQDGIVQAGEYFTYTITVTNTGTVKAKDVMIKDDLANVIGHIEDPSSVMVMIGTNSYTLADLQAGIKVDINAGATVKVKFTVRLAYDFDSNEISILENVAEVNELTPEAEIPTGQAILTSTKDVKDANGDGYAEAGEALTYTITAANSGNVDKIHVLIKDSLTNLYSHIDNPNAVVVYLNNGGTLQTLTLNDLMEGIHQNIGAGKSLTLVFTVILKDSFDASEITFLKNIAAVHDLEPEIEIPTGYPMIGADKIVKDENQDGKAAAGEALTYTISVKNAGKVKAKDVLIKDDLANLLGHIQDSTKVTVMVGMKAHTLAELQAGIYVDLDAGELLEVKFTVFLKDDFDAKEVKVLKNLATVGDEKPEVEIPTGYYEIKAGKYVKDSSGDGYAAAGEALTYTIVVENNGNITAKDIMVQDDLANLLGHIKDYKTVTVKVGAKEYTLEELMKGITLDIKEDDLVEFVFTIVLKDEFDAKKIKVLMNIVKVGDLEAEAKIDTFLKDKGILGEIKPKPDKPQGILGQVKPLPATGQSNQVMVGAALLVLIGIGLVVKKREEDE